MMRRISVVTVTYNASESIRTTIESVLSQTCCDFEYLIADGLSSDGTVSIAEEYRVAFEKRNIQFKVLSQKDCGIYNAMNQAAKEVSGEYILYLNSGDQFYDSGVLSKVMLEMESYPADIYYGDTVMTEMGLYKYVTAASLDTMADGIPFCHQSVFTSTQLLRDLGYDEKWKVCADYDFYSRVYVSGTRFKYCNFPISIYALGGASSSDDSKGYWYEKLEIAYQNNLLTEKAFQEKRAALDSRYQRRKYILLIKKLVPLKMVTKRQVMSLLRDGWHVDAHEAVSTEVRQQKISKSKILFRKVWTALQRNHLNVKGCVVINHQAKIKKTNVVCSGVNNRVLIMPGCYLENCVFHFYGDNNTVILWNNGVYINVDFWLEDAQNQILCDEGVKITGKTQLAATEGKCISLGSDCLLSDEIIIRTGDSHAIYQNGKRINHAVNVKIGKHVWIGHGVNILKGAVLPEGCIVGTGAVVGKANFSNNSIIAGNPAIERKTNVFWTFER